MSVLRRPLGALRLLVAVGMAVGGATGCASREAAPTPITTPPPERVVLRTGEQVDMFDLTFEIRSVDAAQPNGGTPRLAVTIRARNDGDIPVLSPDVAVTCEENREGGDWFDDSTWETNAIIPPGVISEGVFYGGLPPKPDAPTFPLMVCTDAEIRVVATRGVDRHQVVGTLAVPDDVVRRAIDAV